MKLTNLKWAMLLLVACVAFVSCSDDDENVKGKDMWGNVLRGDDMKLQFYPDHFAFYWEYTFDAEANPNIGLIVEGQFPESRFLSYNVYDDDLTASYCSKPYSVEDVNIIPDAGSTNPFKGGAYKEGQKYTLYILPMNTPESYAKGKANVIWFDTDVKRACTILRYYLPTGDGVHGRAPMPLVKGVDVTTGKEVPAPARAKCKLLGDMEMPKTSFTSSPLALFFRAPFAQAYPNGPAEYSYCLNTLEKDKVVYFNFKAPSFPKNADEFDKVDMRYWSICVGNEDTYTPLAISDSQTKIDANGMAHYVMVDRNSPTYGNVKFTAEEKGYNMLVWDGNAWGEGFMILYRHMVYKDGYAYSLRNDDVIKPVLPGVNVMANPGLYICGVALGEWGAAGVKMDADAFVAAHGEVNIPFPARRAN